MADEHVCDRCGEVFKTPKKIDFAVSTTTHPDGSKDIKTQPAWVSSCCEEHYETFLV